MDRQRLSRIAHTRHPIAAPLSDDSVGRLLDLALRDGTARMLDLGCGQAPWLLRALARRPALRAVGVDLDAEALTAARRGAEALGVVRRIGLHHQDVRKYRVLEPFDLVLCVGAAHAFGGLLPALAAVREALVPGGLALVGECFWEREPSAAALAALDRMPTAEYADLPTTVARVTEDGWTPVQGHISSLEERDEYELSWTGSLAEWALDHPDDPDSAEAARLAADHRTGWLTAHRGTLGFVTLLLRK